MNKGCLLIHGLTGTPTTVATLKEALLARGYRVASPLLAGHGGSLDELAATTWQEWYETVRFSFETLRKDVDKVYFAGISLGALLGLKLALDEGWGVRAMALIATPLKLPLLSLLAAVTVKNSPLRWIIKNVPKDWEKSVADPQGREDYKNYSLEAIPSNSVFEITKLEKFLIKRLNKISNPLLLLHSKDDPVAPIGNVALIKKRVVSDIVETKIYSRSRHVLTMDYDKNDVANTVVDFFEKFA